MRCRTWRATHWRCDMKNSTQQTFIYRWSCGFRFKLTHCSFAFLVILKMHFTSHRYTKFIRKAILSNTSSGCTWHSLASQLSQFLRTQHPLTMKAWKSKNLKKMKAVANPRSDRSLSDLGRSRQETPWSTVSKRRCKATSTWVLDYFPKREGSHLACLHFACPPQHSKRHRFQVSDQHLSNQHRWNEILAFRTRPQAQLDWLSTAARKEPWS